MRNLKINQFYIIMAVVMILLAGLVIISLRGIFGAIYTAGQINEELLSSTLPHVDSSKLDEAIDASEAIDFTPLDF